MAIESEIKLAAIEFGEGGVVSVKLMKRLLADGVLIWEEPHRAVIASGVDPSTVMTQVNQHIANIEVRFGPTLATFPPLDQSRIDRITNAVSNYRSAAARARVNANLRSIPQG